MEIKGEKGKRTGNDEENKKMKEKLRGITNRRRKGKENVKDKQKNKKMKEELRGITNKRKKGEG